MKPFPILLGILFAASTLAQTPYDSSAEFERYARMLREKALLKLEPQVVIPTANRPLNRPKYPWRNNIVTTTFWIGEAASANNPVNNHASCWDLNWSGSYGGFDNPDPAARRNGFIPVNFLPKQNPFYCALPYNDVTRGTTKPEAHSVIPWFNDAFERDGQSVCRDRWIRIRSRGGKDCYAQWSDCGPFRTDHWQYVFGDERPKPNLNQGAGLDVSPAVRDYLTLSSTDVTDWQFVDFKDVPRGPWSMYGDNNSFVQLAHHVPLRSAKLEPPKTSAPTPQQPVGP
ncbi:MAG TPA: hypothetical protein VEO95_13350, partial [Chthoniobacteraceae bacterium]|nr:hypothetical protein [Chthoniobacteraceae bacterium]